MEAAASAKKFCAVAVCVDSHQPPVPMNTSRAVCASTGPTTLAAPCDEKYIDDARPMKAYIGAAVDRYCRLAARTPASLVKMLTQMSGKIAMKVAMAPTERNETKPAVQAIRRARAIARADCHADHRHRGDANRERHRRQQEFESRADAVAGQDFGAEISPANG